MKMRKITGVLLAAALALSLTACAQTGQTGAGGTETAAVSEGTEIGDSATEAVTAEAGSNAAEDGATEAGNSAAEAGNNAAEAGTTEAESGASDTGVTEAASDAADAAGTDTAASDGEGKTLVAYFSWSGNTEEMASYIAQQTGGDLLEIQPETPYPTDYEECGDMALAEGDNNERPAIANLPDSIAEYDTLVIGYPKLEQGFTRV